MAENYEEYKDWCFSRHIFFYGYTSDSPAGFCKIVQWTFDGNEYQKKLGKLDVPISNAEQKIDQLYRQVYMNNNKQSA